VAAVTPGNANEIWPSASPTGVRAVDGVRVLYPVAGQRGLRPAAARGPARRLQKARPVLLLDEAAGDVRWMCSFDTTEADRRRLRRGPRGRDGRASQARPSRDNRTGKAKSQFHLKHGAPLENTRIHATQSPRA